MLVAINQAQLKGAVDRLLLISENRSDLPPGYSLQLSGDGIVLFADLIGAGLVQSRFHESSSGGGGFAPYQLFSVLLTVKGELVVAAWKAGQFEHLKAALALDSTRDR